MPAGAEDEAAGGRGVRRPRRATRPATRDGEPVLPEQTTDDTDAAEDWRDRESGERDRDAWLQNERPPHWE